MSQTCEGNIKIFSCNANKKLAEEISVKLNIPLGKSLVTRFADGEVCTRIEELVRGLDIFIVQPTSAPVNEHLMELLIMIDAMSRASAGRITAVIPYYGYARQDRKARARDPISAKLVADLITTAGADRVLTMDLHCDQIQGFFNLPVDHLRGMPIFADYYLEKIKSREDLSIVSPDLGSVSRARNFADRLEAPLAIVDKRRPKPNMSEVMNIIGDVKDKTTIILDDIIDTAGSIVNAAKAIKEAGAKEVFACCTHAIFSGEAIHLIEESEISELLVLNTIDLPDEKQTSKIKIKSVAPMFAAAIDRIHSGRSISKLFD